MSDLMTRLLESSFALPVLLVVKATLLLMLAYLATLFLPARAAAARHLVWALTAAMLLALPLASAGLPEWRMPLVPATASAPLGAGVEAPGSTSRSADPGVIPPVSGPAWGVEPGSPGVGAVGSSAGARGVLRRVASPAGLLALWAVGAAAVLAWLLVGQLLLRLVLRRAVLLRDPGWDGPVADAAWLLEVDRPVRLFRSGAVSVPMTWGFVRPVVLVPDAAESWPDDRRRVVLLHELSHVARLDGLTQILSRLACALYWFHPGVWYASRRMRIEREHACDDLVLSAGTPPPEYAAHLLELARNYRRALASPMPALPMARASHLEGRLLRVLAGPSGRRTPTRVRTAMAAAAVLVLTLPLAALQPTVATAAGPAAWAAEATTAEQEPLLAEGPAPAPEPPAAPTPEPRAAPARESQAAETAAVDPLAAALALGVDRGAASDTTPGQRDRRESGTIRISDTPDSVAAFVPRVPLSAASYAITTTDGATALLLLDRTIVLQLTDRGLEEIGRSHEGEDEGDFLKALLASMLRGGLRMLLDRGLEYSLADLREARYENGRLVLENVRGSDVFQNVNVTGGPIMEAFSERDARAFARRANAARARLP
jgi:beta-lactamase regulating signal transducer with metallopeptidase domain